MLVQIFHDYNSEWGGLYINDVLAYEGHDAQNIRTLINYIGSIEIDNFRLEHWTTSASNSQVFDPLPKSFVELSKLPEFPDGPYLRTAEEWLKVYPIKILDPDGWREKGTAWEDEISLWEFIARIGKCTINTRSDGLRSLQIKFNSWLPSPSQNALEDARREKSKNEEQTH